MPLSKVLLYFVENGIGIDAREAAVITVHALLLSIDGAGTAGKVYLDAVIGILPPPHESGGRMCRTPN